MQSTNRISTWSGSKTTDLVALILLSITLGYSLRDLILSPVRSGLDSISFFWPAYAFLGEELRAGRIPGWNPYQFSGIPFAADPESGWWYWPAMLVFGLFELALAVKIYAAAHVILTAFGTYAYGRVIGLVPAGALVAAWSVSQGGYLTDRSRCCYAHIQVVAWIPLVLLGFELALRASKTRSRLAWWTLSGVALSQLISGWLGQGAMYALLLVGVYVLWRTITGPEAPTGWQRQALDIVRHGAPPVLIALGLAMPAILPRLLYRSQTNLADGYSGSAANEGGWSVARQLEQMLTPSGWFFGATILMLAILGAWLGRHDKLTIFYVALSLGSFVLGLDTTTPLHQIGYWLIPGFESFHTHHPERVAIVFVFGPVILAGVAIGKLWKQAASRDIRPGLGIAVGVLGLILLLRIDVPADTWATVIGLLILLMALALGMARLAPYGHAVTILVILLVLVDLSTGANQANERGNFVRIDPAEVVDQNATAEFIDDQTSVYPLRYLGYDPSLSTIEDGEVNYYRHSFRQERTADLLVNNQGMLWQISDSQGYNPLQLQTYVDFLTALNGGPQEYHGGYVLESGLASPLLPLLAIDYVIVPLDIPTDRADLRFLINKYPEAHRTDEVRILKVTDSLPRSWITHDIEYVPADQTFATLQGVDISSTVVLNEDEDLGIEPVISGTLESAEITAWSPDEMSLSVSLQSQGLVVIGEPWAEGWSAQVDGKPADLLKVDGFLRGVVVPAGDHEVVLTYSTPGLTGSLLTSTGTLAILVLAFVYTIRPWREAA